MHRSKPVVKSATACGIIAVMFLMGLSQMNSAHALTAWARKYDVPCSTCHSMAFPKLNNMGFMFRRLGYRMPGEVTGDTEAKKVDFTNYLAFANRFEYRGKSPAFKGDSDLGAFNSSGGFRYHDVKLFGAGPVDDHWSLFVEANLGDDGGFGVAENAFMTYRTGKNVEHFATVKIGQFHTLDGIGPFDRPLVVGRPLPLTMLVNGFSLANNISDQRGVQLGLTSKNNHVLGSIMNGVTMTGEGTPEDLGGQQVQDTNSAKDFLLQAYHIFDAEGSSVGGFIYQGTTRFQPTPADPVFEDKFHQVGIGGSYFFNPRVTVLGALTAGKHDKPAGGSFNDRSHYVEADFAAAPGTSLMAKYEHTKVDAGSFLSPAEKKANIWTAGVVHFFGPNAKFSLQYSRRTGTGASKAPVAELWFTF